MASPSSPILSAKTNSHLLMLLAKLRTGTAGRATTARLATEETARRANISAVVLGGGVEWWWVYEGECGVLRAARTTQVEARSLALLAGSPAGFDLARTSPGWQLAVSNMNY